MKELHVHVTQPLTSNSIVSEPRALDSIDNGVVATLYAVEEAAAAGALDTPSALLLHGVLGATRDALTAIRAASCFGGPGVEVGS